MKRLIAFLVFFSHFNCFSGDNLLKISIDEKSSSKIIILDGICEPSLSLKFTSPEDFLHNYLLTQNGLNFTNNNNTNSPSLFKLNLFLAGLATAKITGIKIGVKTQSILGILLLGDFVHQNYIFFKNKTPHKGNFTDLEKGFFSSFYGNSYSFDSTPIQNQNKYNEGKKIYEKLKNGNYRTIEPEKGFYHTDTKEELHSFLKEYIQWLKNPTSEFYSYKYQLRFPSKSTIIKNATEQLQKEQNSFIQQKAAIAKENTAMLKNNAFRLAGIGLGIATLNTTHLWAPPLTSLILKTGSLTQKSLQAACSGMYNGCKTVGNGILNTIAN